MSNFFKACLRWSVWDFKSVAGHSTPYWNSTLYGKFVTNNHLEVEIRESNIINEIFQLPNPLLLGEIILDKERIIPDKEELVFDKEKHIYP